MNINNIIDFFNNNELENNKLENNELENNELENNELENNELENNELKFLFNKNELENYFIMNTVDNNTFLDSILLNLDNNYQLLPIYNRELYINEFIKKMYHDSSNKKYIRKIKKNELIKLLIEKKKKIDNTDIIKDNILNYLDINILLIKNNTINLILSQKNKSKIKLTILIIFCNNKYKPVLHKNGNNVYSYNDIEWIYKKFKLK
jgi:hypothetical protein